MCHLIAHKIFLHDYSFQLHDSPAKETKLQEGKSTKPVSGKLGFLRSALAFSATRRFEHRSLVVEREAARIPVILSTFSKLVIFSPNFKVILFLETLKKRY